MDIFFTSSDGPASVIPGLDRVGGKWYGNIASPLELEYSMDRGAWWATVHGDHLICLLRNLYAGQEATVRTEHGTTD